jgi:hypothetical protein
MASLIDLPQPIRLQILRTLLTSERERSTSLYEFHAQDPYQRLLRHGRALTEEHIERQIRYPSRICLPFEGILRVNRQLRYEMKYVIREFTTKKVNCKLDVIVECEDKVYPTWLKCPARSPQVHRLEVDVRLLGCVGTPDACLHSKERGRCRSIAFAIVAILARFVERGARFEHARGEISVHHMVLDFSSREGGEKFLELTPASPVDGENWDTDTLIEGEENAEAEDELVSPPAITGGQDLGGIVDGAELLRTVDLVLKPLHREPQYLLERRRKHFSAGHLALIRKNVRRIFLRLDGKLERRISVKGGLTG